MCSEFLWNQKIPLVSWKSICKDKKYGGLGVFSAKTWNCAAALKLLWIIHLKKDSLWIKWVHGNYLQQSDIWQVHVKLNDSWMWKQLLKVRDKLIRRFGSVNSLQNILSKCCIGEKISISGVYRILLQPDQVAAWYNTVWDNISYPKHSFVTWLAIQSRLLTQDRLCGMGILAANQCVMCTNFPESCGHLFFDCQFSALVWNMVMDWLKFSWRSCSWGYIINWYNSRLKRKGFMEKLKRMALTASIYWIWQERNFRIFQSKARQPEKIFRAIRISIFSKIMNDNFPIHIKERIQAL
ncbi:uncharacterized protein LOC109846766 [Asparagus officinalis]|uniref:uncharacterized protein LOC109846766 n=1 Tax=Asparagus officinalis TaxID=4686 RepID=UPI00098E544D|nr:uncharacterized protein LOC109846766 [Asparagus officinalis]